MKSPVCALLLAISCLESALPIYAAPRTDSLRQLAAGDSPILQSGLEERLRGEPPTAVRGSLPRGGLEEKGEEVKMLLRQLKSQDPAQWEAVAGVLEERLIKPIPISLPELVDQIQAESPSEVFRAIRDFTDAAPQNVGKVQESYRFGRAFFEEAAVQQLSLWERPQIREVFLKWLRYNDVYLSELPAVFRMATAWAGHQIKMRSELSLLAGEEHMSEVQRLRKDLNSLIDPVVQLTREFRSILELLQEGNSAGLEEQKAAVYQEGAERIQAAMRQMGIQTALSPGEAWTLSKLSGPDGHVSLIPMDQQMIHHVAEDPAVYSDSSTGDVRYRLVIGSRLYAQARALGRKLGFLFGEPVVHDREFRKLRQGRRPYVLEPYLPSGASLDAPFLVQGEDPGIPRWQGARQKVSLSEALQMGAVGYKTNVMLGIPVPDHPYHSRWGHLVERNLEFVQGVAHQIREETGGLGFGYLAGALIYAAPPSDYVPTDKDLDKTKWKNLLEKLEGLKKTWHEFTEELAKGEPADWAVDIQTQGWLNSEVKRDMEASEEFAQAHQQMTYRIVEAWNRTPGITLIMAAGPYFVATRKQWATRREKAIQAMEGLKRFGPTKLILLSRNRPAPVYQDELKEMISRRLIVGAALGRTLFRPLFHQMAGKESFYPMAHTRFMEAMEVSKERLQKNLALFEQDTASIWESYGIAPGQAAAFLAAGLEEAELQRQLGLLGDIGSVKKFLWKEQAQGRDWTPTLKAWALDTDWWKHSLGPAQRTGILQWLVSKVERFRMGDSPAKADLYSFFRHLATRSLELPSVREQAVKGMRLLARTREDQQEVFEVIKLLWEKSLTWTGSQATSMENVHRSLRISLECLELLEAQYWTPPQTADGNTGLEERMGQARPAIRQIVQDRLKLAVLIEPAAASHASAAELVKVARRLRRLNGYPVIEIRPLSEEAAAQYRADGYQVVQVRIEPQEPILDSNIVYVRLPAGSERLIPKKFLPLLVTDAVALWQKAKGRPLSSPIILPAAPYLNTRGLSFPRIRQTLTDLFA